MKFSARFYSFILFFFLLIGFFFVSPKKTLAQSPAPVQQQKQNPFDFNLQNFIDTKINNRDPEVLKKGVNISVDETEGYRLPVIAAEGANMLIPLDPRLNPKEVRAVPALAMVMTKMYEYPPASAMAYTYDVLANAGLITKPAYAQGIGFAGLAPLLPLWKASRNISYAILIIVMVAIGFMIIFRTKIDPKTVISVQAALPKIILTLILITFSYPIAGFFIDVMYLTILLFIEIISKAIPPDLPLWADFMTKTSLRQTDFIQTGLGGWGNLFTSVFSFGLIPAFFQQFFGGSAGNVAIIGGGVGGLGLGALISNLWLGGTLLSAATFLPGFLLGVLGIGVIIILLIGLGLLFTFIRLTFLLINSYIQILISVILGPLLLLKEAIPGQSAFGDWVKGLLANLIVFPATVAIIYFSWIMTAVTWNSNLWGAPLIPVGGGGDIGGKGNPLAVFIGLGIIFLAPNLVASIKKVFKAKPAVPVTAGTAFSPLTGAVQTTMGGMQSFYYFQQPFVSGALSGLAKYVPGLDKLVKHDR